jgi:hypothetical protein
VRPRRLLIIKIRANISNVGVSEADNLPRVAWVGENFLVSGEAGIENDFPAPARDGAGGAAVKDTPVFERENRGAVLDFGQFLLRENSFVLGFRRRKRPEMIDWPVREYCAAIDEAAGYRSEDAGIVRADAMISHNEVTVARHAHRPKVA